MPDTARASPRKPVKPPTPPPEQALFPDHIYVTVTHYGLPVPTDSIEKLKELIMSLIEDVATLSTNVEEVRILVGEVVTAIATKDEAQEAALQAAKDEIQRLIDAGTVTAEQMAALQASIDQMIADQQPVADAVAAANAGLDTTDETLRSIRDSQSA